MTLKEFWLCVGIVVFQLTCVLLQDRYSRSEEREICRRAVQRAYGKTRAEVERVLAEQHDLEGK